MLVSSLVPKGAMGQNFVLCVSFSPQFSVNDDGRRVSHVPVLFV